MKKIILISLFLLTTLFAEEQEAKLYTGVSIGYSNEAFAGTESKTDSGETLKFKVGYGIREAYAIELSLDYTANDSTIFSTSPNKDGDKIGLNIELVKAFDWDIFILPYFKAGFGAGSFEISNQYDPGKNSLKYSSFNLGLGMFIPVNEHLDFEIGYDYKYLSYEKFEVMFSDVKSNTNALYLGVNVRF